MENSTPWKGHISDYFADNSNYIISTSGDILFAPISYQEVLTFCGIEGLYTGERRMLSETKLVSTLAGGFTYAIAQDDVFFVDVQRTPVFHHHARAEGVDLVSTSNGTYSRTRTERKLVRYYIAP